MESGKRVRARPLPPEDRREHLIDATLGLLRVHGRAVTSRQIAEQAGVAEGTIFRVFDTKDDLVGAAIARAFEPGDVLARLEEIDPDLPLRDRLVVAVSVLQQRFLATFGLMQKVGLVGPPHRDAVQAAERRAQIDRLLVDMLATDADRLVEPPEHVVHVLRLLTFAGSHQLIADGRLLTPEQIVDTVLTGLEKDL